MAEQKGGEAHEQADASATQDQAECCPEGAGECSDEPGHVTPSEGHCPNCCAEGCTDCAGAPYTRRRGNDTTQCSPSGC